jgi:hypothetical protein
MRIPHGKVMRALLAFIGQDVTNSNEERTTSRDHADALKGKPHSHTRIR